MIGGHESRLATVMRDLEKRIDEATDMLAFTADRHELDDAAFELLRLRNKFDSLTAEFFATAQAAGIHFGSRIRTMPTYVAAESNVAPAPIRRATRRGEWLRGYPVFAEAHRSGDLAIEHLDHIRKHLDASLHGVFEKDPLGVPELVLLECGVEPSPEDVGLGRAGDERDALLPRVAGGPLPHRRPLSGVRAGRSRYCPRRWRNAQRAGQRRPLRYEYERPSRPPPSGCGGC